MKSSFDNQLRKMFEDITPEDAGISFDRERVWKQVNSRSHKKILPLRSWLTHVAAAIAGIIVAGYFFSRHDNRDVIRQESYASNIPPVQAEKPESRATPEKAIPAAPATTTVRSSAVRRPAAAPAQEQRMEVLAKTDTAPLNKQPLMTEVQESVAGLLPQQRRNPAKILHLADMNNENGIHHYTDSKPETQHFRIASLEETKEQESGMLSALISSYVANKKFK